MPARNYLALFLLALCVIAAVASVQTAPGYMDAEYYYSGGVQLASGQGFNENFLWNYLDDPSGVPHPSHLYWMPMASILAALGPAAAGRIDFNLARLPFILLGALVAPATAGLAYCFTKRRDLALFAGVLAAFPGYYLAYLSTIDTFGPVMLIGAAFLALAAALPARFNRAAYPQILLLGICAGLMHLSRADGLLWLGYAFLVVLWSGLARSEKDAVRAAGFWERRPAQLAAGIFCALLGYLAVMAPWLLRNLTQYHTLMAPGASNALWERNYNELFAYPATTLSFATWAAQGIGTILAQRFDALASNLKSALGVQMEIVLAPFILVGLWSLRRERIVQMAVAIWVLTLGVMSFAYPFAGARGGFFHSGSAVQPVLWAAAPLGFSRAIDWAARLRKWSAPRAMRLFAPPLGLIVILLTGVNTYRLVIGADPASMAWNQSLAVYRQLEQSVVQFDPSQHAGVLVNNPAGYSLVSARPAYVIPNGGLETLLAVARRYDARYVLLDQNIPEGLIPVYEQPEQAPGLMKIASIDQTTLFQVVSP